MARLAEFDLIAQVLRPLAADPQALNLEDDAAIIDGPGDMDWVIAKDAIVENVHFRTDDPPGTVATKLLGTNLSDLAAMGATPAFYLTVIARSQSTSDMWLEQFCQGMAETQKTFALQLLGGDTVSTTGPIVLTCTIIGQIPKSQALRRNAARFGDLIFVSGTLGDAAMGLRILNGLAATDDARIYLTKRYQCPQPRVALGQALRGLATACVDISDGMAADIGHIAKASKLQAKLHIDRLPISEHCRHMPDAHLAALSGGDDYELAFTAPASAKTTILNLSKTLKIPLTLVGEMGNGSGVTVLDSDGRAMILQKTGWQHT